MLHFFVRDTGVGIPRDRLASIFEAFTQADGAMTRTYGGTGLGLTSSSQLVHLMGGRIWVKSEAGQGSTFHFTARFALANAQPAMAAIPDAVDLQGLSVLVVDDNATNRCLLDKILTGWGMLPTLAPGVAEALAALRAAHASGRAFPLVLTDLRMPDADGFILASSIQRDQTMAGIAIVMLTSAGQPGDAARCRELGIAAYLPKPIKRSDLRRAIQLALVDFAETPVRPVPGTRHSVRTARRF